MRLTEIKAKKKLINAKNIAISISIKCKKLYLYAIREFNIKKNKPKITKPQKILSENINLK